MILLWKIIATFLYAEIGLIVLLILPIISASRWQIIFKSRLLSFFRRHSTLYFNILVFVLMISFVDECRKYNTLSEKAVGATVSMENKYRMKIFRTHRNLYIAGTAILLFIVLRKLIVFISRIAALEVDIDDTKRQAESTLATAKKKMVQHENVDNKKASPKVSSVSNSNEINQLKKDFANTNTKLQKSYDDLEKSKLTMNSMKKQALGANQEYNRLLSEFDVLQEKLNVIEDDGSCK